MARVKRGNVARQRRKKNFKLAKGFRGSLSTLYRPSHQAVLNKLQHQYRDRRRRKREFRALWIVRLSAALGLHEMSYSKFVGLAAKKQVLINRKVLSDLAISNPEIFSEVVQFVKV